MPAEVAPGLPFNTTEPMEAEIKPAAIVTALGTALGTANRQTQLTISLSRRRPQKLQTYFLVCLCQTISIFIPLLLILVPAERLKYVYMFYIIFTCVRAVVFSISSLQLIGFTKDLYKLYFLIDNVLLVMMASAITYVFLNYYKQIPNIMGSMICYPILLFFLTGNGRVMLVFCEWQSWQVVLYKSIKLIGSTFFLIYGCYVLTSKSVAEDQREIFLLWIFTTCAFWAEMCFQVNTKDESDSLNTNYILLDADQ